MNSALSLLLPSQGDYTAALARQVDDLRAQRDALQAECDQLRAALNGSLIDYAETKQAEADKWQHENFPGTSTEPQTH